MGLAANGANRVRAVLYVGNSALSGLIFAPARKLAIGSGPFLEQAAAVCDRTASHTLFPHVFHRLSTLSVAQKFSSLPSPPWAHAICQHPSSTQTHWVTAAAARRRPHRPLPPPATPSPTRQPIVLSEPAATDSTRVAFRPARGSSRVVARACAAQRRYGCCGGGLGWGTRGPPFPLGTWALRGCCDTRAHRHVRLIRPSCLFLR